MSNTFKHRSMNRLNYDDGFDYNIHENLVSKISWELKEKLVSTLDINVVLKVNYHWPVCNVLTAKWQRICD